MSQVNVRIGKISFGGARAFELKLASSLTDVAKKDFLKRKKVEMGRMIKSTHSGAYDVVQRILRRGVNLSAGTKSIPFVDPNTGASRKYQTGTSWSPLSIKYANRTPKSKVFWRKHFSPAPYGSGNRLPLLVLFLGARLHTSSARSSVTRYRKATRGAEYATWRVLIKSPDNALNALISEPMVRASQFKGPTKFVRQEQVSTNDISFIQIVEEQRPFIVGLSSAVGAGMFKRMRGIMREP